MTRFRRLTVHFFLKTLKFPAIYLRPKNEGRKHGNRHRRRRFETLEESTRRRENLKKEKFACTQS